MATASLRSVSARRVSYCVMDEWEGRSVERRAYMFVDEFLDAVFDDVFQRLAFLNRERMGLQYILQPDKFS